MWDQGIEVFDGFANETFKMHAMLFYTINDFLAYCNLSRYSVKGHKHVQYAKKTPLLNNWNMEGR